MEPLPRQPVSLLHERNALRKDTQSPLPGIRIASINGSNSQPEGSNVFEPEDWFNNNEPPPGLDDIEKKVKDFINEFIHLDKRVVLVTVSKKKIIQYPIGNPKTRR